jgi:ribonuclease Z
VWTGDGRPDETTIEFAKGVDVFVTEGQTESLDNPTVGDAEKG